MAVKIRLQRRGRKKRPFYAIVVADSRAPRDGKFIEKLGYYDPTTNPATVELNFERAVYWLNVGAIPTDTARSLLSYKGVLYWRHLMRGVKKGAFSEEEAKKRFDEWLAEKNRKIREKREKIIAAEKAEIEKRNEVERKIREKREKELAEKYAKKAEAEAKEQAEKTNNTEE